MVRMRSNLHDFFRMCLKATTYLLMFVCTSVYGTSGTWTQTGNGFWDVGANWTSNPVFPNFQGDVAAFIGSLTGNTVINSNSDITIGALHVNSPDPLGNSLTIGFTTNTLRFDGASQKVAKIMASKVGNFTINTNILLLSDLEVYNNSNLTFSKPIAGIDNKVGVSISNGSSGVVTYTAANTYLGMTYVNNFSLNLTNSTGISLSGSVTVFPEGSLNFQRDNQLSITSNLISSGLVNLFASTQQCKSITVSKPTGNIAGLAGTLVLALNANPGAAFTMGGESQSRIGTLILPNNGRMIYDFGLGLGQAVYGTTNFLSTINLGAGNVTVGLHTGTNAFFDWNFQNTNFSNGSLTIQTLSGPEKGVVCLSGTLGSAIPATDISNAKLLIGFTNTTNVVNVAPAGSTINVQTDGILGGVAILGVAGSANVVSSGLVQPGFPAGSNTPPRYGRLLISGNYTQNATGTLELKLNTPVIFDQLVVDTGDVVLSGTLSLISDPERVLAAGDQFIVVDNTTGANPITGKFTSVNAIIPPELVADVQYFPQTVVVTLQTRCQ